MEVKTYRVLVCSIIHLVAHWWMGSENLSLCPESNALWSQGFGFSFTSWMLNPNHQHTTIFNSSGKLHLVRLRPNLCNSLNEKVEILHRCWMGWVWPLYLELSSLSLFWRERVWLAAHNCWLTILQIERLSVLCKITEGLLRMTDNFLLTTCVPKQFDSADFFTQLEILLI